MISRLRFLAVVGFAFASSGFATERAHVTVLSTTDLHGHVHPIDYYTDEPAEYGLAKIATLIQRARALDPELILLDSGDTIQGRPFAYHCAVIDPPRRNPMMVAMNALDFDALAVGNHEFNYGLDFLMKALAGANFPVVSANVAKGTLAASPTGDETLVPPYVILDRTVTDGAGESRPGASGNDAEGEAAVAQQHGERRREQRQNDLQGRQMRGKAHAFASSAACTALSAAVISSSSMVP